MKRLISIKEILFYNLEGKRATLLRKKINIHLNQKLINITMNKILSKSNAREMIHKIE